MLQGIGTCKQNTGCQSCLHPMSTSNVYIQCLHRRSTSKVYTEDLYRKSTWNIYAAHLVVVHLDYARRRRHHSSRGARAPAPSTQREVQRVLHRLVGNHEDGCAADAACSLPGSLSAGRHARQFFCVRFVTCRVVRFGAPVFRRASLIGHTLSDVSRVTV